MATIGSKIDQLFSLREKKRALEKQVEALQKEISDQEVILIDQMDKEGVDRAAGKFASVSITESVKPSVTDWDIFYKYIKRSGFFHLLERRPSVTGCRELFETKGKIPGVVPFTKRSINLRTRD